MTNSLSNKQLGYQPLYQTLRSGVIESIHFGAVAVVTAAGKIHARAGDPQANTFMRSSSKPFQCIPLLELGGVEKFQISEEELAVICASHSGTDQHLKIITSLQRKVGITSADLLCGSHQPFDKASRHKLRDQGISPTQNHHNCSGKHTGMLAQASLLGASPKEYTKIDHPVQQGILSSFSEICGLDQKQIGLGWDGCSVPTFAVPLYNAAWAWARLMQPDALSSGAANACSQITQAMGSHPFYVAGPGRLDTRLMEITHGRIISKTGAEAFQAFGLHQNAIAPGSPALGIALKISDGDLGKRALSAVGLEVLHQLGALTPEELEGLADLGPVQINRNQRKTIIGEAKPCFQLQFN